MASLNPTAEGLELLSDTEWIARPPRTGRAGGTDDSEGGISRQPTGVMIIRGRT